MGFIFSSPGTGSTSGASSAISCSDLLTKLRTCPSNVVPPEALDTSADIYLLLLGANDIVYWVTPAQLLRGRPLGVPSYVDDTAADADTDLQGGALYGIDGLDRNVFIKPVL